jgi:nitrogen fixation NifU-like protein
MNAIREFVLENYKSPVNRGKPEAYTHSATHLNRSCGDEIEVYLTVVAGKVTSIHYEVRGCALTIATASILSQELQSQAVKDIDVHNQDYLEELLETKLSLGRVKCALLPLEAIKKALKESN